MGSNVIGTYRTKADATRALRWQLKGQRGAPAGFRASFGIKTVRGMAGGTWYQVVAMPWGNTE